jgi:peptide deformylase
MARDLPMILKIRTFDDPVLRKRARKVTRITEDILTLVRDMQETMEANKGVGLAANQVGVLLRIFVWKIDEKEEGVLINPSITQSAGRATDTEGCLSLPGILASVPRAETVTVRGLNLEGRKVERVTTGLLARVIQHEFDHLEGILITDRAVPGSIRRVDDEHSGMEVTPASRRR